MVFLALTSIVAGIFDVKHNLHLQLVPHLSRHHQVGSFISSMGKALCLYGLQYWRLLVHNVACASASDLLLAELLLYNAAILIERAFGTVKYAVFICYSRDPLII